MKLYKQRTLSLLVLLVIPVLAPAAIYKCEINGKTRFQDKPCKNAKSEIISKKANDSNCYQLTDTSGKIQKIDDFWTSKQDGKSMFYAHVNNNRRAISSKTISNIKVNKVQKNCVESEISQKDGTQLSATLCFLISAQTQQGVIKITPTQLKHLSVCKD